VKLTVGLALHSAVDSTSLMVTKAPNEAGAEIEITVGGEPVSADELGLELLCAKSGSAVLAVNGAPLGLREAKPLPASD